MTSHFGPLTALLALLLYLGGPTAAPGSPGAGTQAGGEATAPPATQQGAGSGSAEEEEDEDCGDDDFFGTQEVTPPSST